MESLDPIAWLIIAILGLLGMGWTISQRARPKPVTPGKSEIEQKAENKARKDEQDATAARDKAVADAKDEAAKENEQLVKDLEGGKDKLLENNDALTDHLKNVGKDVRGAGG